VDHQLGTLALYYLHFRSVFLRDPANSFEHAADVGNGVLDYPEIEAQVRDFLLLCEQPKEPEEADNRDKLLRVISRLKMCQPVAQCVQLLSRVIEAGNAISRAGWCCGVLFPIA
jgi:hypothetical protein